METIILVPTNAPFVQDLLPKKLAAILIVLQKKIIVPVKETRMGHYELKLKIFCEQLLKIKKLPPAGMRFLQSKLKKISPDDKALIPFEAVDQEIPFGVPVANDRSCTLCF